MIDATDMGPELWKVEEIGTYNLRGEEITLDALIEIVDMREAVGDEFSRPYTVMINVLPSEKYTTEETKRTALSVHEAEHDLSLYSLRSAHSYGYNIQVDQSRIIDAEGVNYEGCEATFSDYNEAKRYISEEIVSTLETLSDNEIEDILYRRLNQVGKIGEHVLLDMCFDEDVGL